jgi:prepilin-type N-terminal cleavage/methylation domain-containing protein
MARRTRSIERRRGFTLAESLMASTVLAAAVVAMIAPLCASHRQAEAMTEATTATGLARQLLEEIAAKPFDDPNGATQLGPEAGETSRALYNNTDDYDGYTDATIAAGGVGQIAMLDGSTVSIANGQGYLRSVTVRYLSGRAGPVAATGEYALVTVTVTAPSGRLVQLQRVVTHVKSAL